MRQSDLGRVYKCALVAHLDVEVYSHTLTVLGTSGAVAGTGTALQVIILDGRFGARDRPVKGLVDLNKHTINTQASA